MALQDYARLPVFYNGALMEEVTSVSMTTNSGQIRIDTLTRGLSGFSPGSGDVTFEIGIVIPIGGQEFPIQQDCAEGNYVELQLGVGKDKYIGRGKIETQSLSQSVNAAAEGTFTWTGEKASLQ